MADTSDKELLAAAQSGDPDALDALLAAHEKQVYRFGLRMCGDEEDAREVLQETFLAAFRHLPGFQGKAALSTWLFQIARSFCIKLRRRRVDEPAIMESIHEGEGIQVAAEDDTPDKAAHAREIRRALQAAILSLSPQDREVIVLRDVEGLSAEEAAEVVGIEVGALKSRLHRARVALRSHLSAVLNPSLNERAACPELAEELAGYATAEIDQATCVELERHLKSCPRCADACESLKKTVSLCRQIPGGDVPGPVKAAVRFALREITTAADPT